jgi:hypothetical protein
MFYLGNFRIDKTIESDVEEAAKIIKRDIRFLNEPMPHISKKVEREDKFSIDFGSIAVYDGKKDCSKFWTAFNEIRKNRDSEESS